MWSRLGICFVFLVLQKVDSQSTNKLGFKTSPTVTAECTERNMLVRVQTQEAFAGIVNAQGFRDTCATFGDGSQTNTVLIIPLLTNPTEPLYCGLSYDLASGEVRVRIEVHAHKILELESDKTFFISCSQNGVLGDGNLHLSLVQDGQEVSRATQGNDYTVRITYTNATIRNNQQLAVTSCVALGRKNSTLFLSDSRGCPTAGSPLGRFSSTGNTAEAPVKSMIRFQDSALMSMQCEVSFCKAPCPQLLCPGDAGYDANRMSGAQKMPRADGNQQGLVASTIAVQEPGSSTVPVAVGSNNCGYGEWVLALCITFGILFLIMLIVNIIMCSAISCNCTSKEQTEEVHPEQVWGEYDTVKNAWTNSMSGSVHGDRHSMHSVPVGGGVSQFQAPVARGQSPYYHPPTRHLEDSEMRDARSFQSAPHAGYTDHYAMVHRPGSAAKY